MRNTWRPALFVLFVSFTALFFGTGLHPLWLLTWIAPIPVLLLALLVSRKIAFVVALLAWSACELNQWHYFHAVLGMPTPIVLVIVWLPALFFAADVLLYRWLLQKSAWRAALVFPCFWVVCEFLGESTSIHGTAGNISYSQMNFLPVVQLASVTGIWGISFCIFLFASTASVLLSGNAGRAEKRVLGIAVGLTFAAVLSYGGWRLYSTPAAQTVEVGLLASDLPQNILTEEHNDTLRLMHQYAVEAEKLAAQGANVVIIPEKIAILHDSDLPEVDPLFTSVAAKTGASVVVGVIHPTSNARWNEARMYLPDGRIRTYEKHHMLPPFESPFTVGTEQTEWKEPSGRWGMTICKDMDFPALSRDYGKDGTGLLLVPAWDFNLDGWLHGRMAILRGVESGFSIARAPKQGILTITDDRGRVLAERETNSAPFASLVAAVPVRHDDTLYARWGNWFAWVNIAGLVLLIVSGIGKERRTQSLVVSR
jgi:apolipoprotein N-acyltransferase